LRLKFLLTLKWFSLKQREEELARYQRTLADPDEKELCDIALAAMKFFRNDNSAAQYLFSKSLNHFRHRKGAEAEYLKLFCIVYINLLRRNLDGAAMHARRSKFLKANLLVRSIFPIPDLEEKVLFQNSIEAIG